MEKKWIVTGLVLLITGIVLGAFGAHALKKIISDPDQLAAFETGVRYQLIHGVAFLAVPFIASRFGLTAKWPYRLLLAGVLLFSVSIYALTLCNAGGMESMKKAFGPVTPIGGLLLIFGWISLLAAVVRKK